MISLIKWAGLGQVEPKFQILIFVFLTNQVTSFFLRNKKTWSASTTHYWSGPINFLLQKLKANLLKFLRIPNPVIGPIANPLTHIPQISIYSKATIYLIIVESLIVKTIVFNIQHSFIVYQNVAQVIQKKKKRVAQSH